MPFQLKDYQRRCLDELAQFLRRVIAHGRADLAFYEQTGRAYRQVRALPGLPYVCVRVPTGDAIVLVLDGSGAVKERYLQGPDIDQPLAEEDVEGDVRWFLADHLGTVRDVVDSDGGLLNHVVYDTFGNVLSQTNSAYAPRFAFAGRELDAESGLYYNRLRYYDPAAGRFISEDPIGFAGGDGNLYRYVGNSPLNFTDPMGLSETAPEAEFSWGGTFAKALAENIGNTLANIAMDIAMPWRLAERAGADYEADRARGLGAFDAGLNASVRNAPLVSAGWGLGEAITGKVKGGVGHGRTLDCGERLGRVGAFVAAESAAGAWAAARWNAPGLNTGLTTPSKYFGSKTVEEAKAALQSKYGPPKSSRPGADTYYDPDTGRSYNVHTDPAHGNPHVDVRRRGGYPDRQYPLKGEE